MDARSGTGNPTPDEVRAALDRVIASEVLRGSPQLIAFFRFVVEATLRGEGHRIKAYAIAVEALGRGEDFDPDIDPIVRVEAGRYGARSSGITRGSAKRTRSSSTFRVASMSRNFGIVRSQWRRGSNHSPS